MNRRPVPTRRASKKQETKVAKQLGGKVQANSGATDYLKGDVVTDNMLIECKTVMKPQKSVTIQKEWFTKNDAERFAMKKDFSALVFDFGDGKDEYIAMDMKTYKHLLEHVAQEAIDNYLDGGE